MKSILSFIISLLPLNAVRIFFYRVFFNYDIDYKSRIGMFNIINCTTFKSHKANIGVLNQIIAENFELEENATIIKLNRFKNIHILKIGANVEIVSGNFFGGPKKGTSNQSIDFKNQNLFIGERSAVLRKNYFDVVEEIHIGKNVVFGGNGSEIWTHGFDIQRKMYVGKVKFGNDIFIGSNCIFTKNVEVANDITIAPGSVIYKSILESGIYSTHQINKVR